MTEITVAKVEPPAPNRKQGTIHDTKGARWKVWADKIPNYAVGSTYEITFKTNQFNNQTFNVIDSAKPLSTASPQQAQAAAATYTHADDKKSEQIAILALVKPWIEKIQVGDAAAMEHAIRAARTAWRQAWKSRVESSRPPLDDMDGDIIPDFPGDR